MPIFSPCWFSHVFGRACVIPLSWNNFFSTVWERASLLLAPIVMYELSRVEQKLLYKRIMDWNCKEGCMEIVHGDDDKWLVMATDIQTRMIWLKTRACVRIEVGRVPFFFFWGVHYYNVVMMSESRHHYHSDPLNELVLFHFHPPFSLILCFFICL